jgi:hypothetical protein
VSMCSKDAAAVGTCFPTIRLKKRLIITAADGWPILKAAVFNCRRFWITGTIMPQKEAKSQSQSPHFHQNSRLFFIVKSCDDLAVRLEHKFNRPRLAQMAPDRLTPQKSIELAFIPRNAKIKQIK